MNSFQKQGSKRTDRKDLLNQDEFSAAAGPITSGLVASTSQKCHGAGGFDGEAENLKCSHWN